MSRGSTLQTHAPVARWESLTWDDLSAGFSAGAVHRGTEYQREGRVENLAISSEGRLEAEVQGTELYYTTVSLLNRRLESHCTCFVGVDCKHGAAVVAEYLSKRESGESIDGSPPATEDKGPPRSKPSGGTL